MTDYRIIDATRFTPKTYRRAMRRAARAVGCTAPCVKGQPAKPDVPPGFVLVAVVYTRPGNLVRAAWVRCCLVDVKASPDEVQRAANEASVRCLIDELFMAIRKAQESERARMYADMIGTGTVHGLGVLQAADACGLNAMREALGYKLRWPKVELRRRPFVDQFRNPDAADAFDWGVSAMSLDAPRQDAANKEAASLAERMAALDDPTIVANPCSEAERSIADTAASLDAACDRATFPDLSPDPDVVEALPDGGTLVNVSHAAGNALVMHRTGNRFTAYTLAPAEAAIADALRALGWDNKPHPDLVELERWKEAAREQVERADAAEAERERLVTAVRDTARQLGQSMDNTDEAMRQRDTLARDLTAARASLDSVTAERNRLANECGRMSNKLAAVRVDLRAVRDTLATVGNRRNKWRARAETAERQVEGFAHRTASQQRSLCELRAAAVDALPLVPIIAVQHERLRAALDGAR